jgi:hypothetical protein
MSPSGGAVKVLEDKAAALTRTEAAGYRVEET